MKKYLAVASFAYLLPVVAFAQAGQLGEVTDFFDNIIAFVNNTLVPLIFALAFLVFIWGVFKYFILGGDDEDKRESGKSLMLWSIIGFVLMVSIWGIVNLLAGGLALDEESIEATIPSAPGPGW